MKNKKTLWIAVGLVVVALVIILLVLRPFGTEKTGESAPAEDNIVAQAGEPTGTDASTEDQNASAETTDSNGSTEEEVSVAQILENEGDIEIIIPEDQESDGF